MPFHQNAPIRYYTFKNLDHPAITHALFTRHGGVSPQPWESLNMGGSLGDDSQRVEQNRVNAFRAVGRDPASLYDVWQVHSAEVVCAQAPRPPDMPYLEADAILTDCPDVTLFMRFADCVPILLFDPLRRVVGLAHAGWQGTVRGVASVAVEAMIAHYGSSPEDIRAAIGPSIGLCHYEVGPEVIEQVRQTFGINAAGLLPSLNAAVQFDLWNANRLLLERSGVCQIEIAGICTACHVDDWYSHRGEYGKTGRFGVLIGLNE